MSNSVLSETSKGVRLKRSLGTPALLVFGLAYMLPLAVFTSYGYATAAAAGHLAGAYVLTTVAMLFTAYSYANMVRQYPVAGSAYTYTQRAFGSHVGFMTGWALLLDYLLLPILSYILIGQYMSAVVPAIPFAVWVIAAIAVVTLLNFIGINLVTNVNLALVGAQIVFVVIFVISSVGYISGNPNTVGLFDPFFGKGADLPHLAAGGAILALAFLGFDAVSTLSEEAREPKKTIPRAILLTTLAGGLIFIVCAWVAGLVFPDYQNLSEAAPTLDLMHRAGGVVLGGLFTAAFVAGSFAAAMTSQVSVSRILYSMGRDGMLPSSVFGRLHARFRTPYLAILIVGALGVVAIVIPLDWVFQMINFGALIAFSFVNLSVFKTYVVDLRQRSGAAILKYVIAPAIGFALTIWLWTSLPVLAFIIGGTWVLIGLVYLAVLTRGFRTSPPVMDFSEEAPVAEVG
ncbi:MAG: putrescine importer [Microbacteriaceae bacterium]|nr:putrescine importer [Microbacteriaceae bacterium]